MRHVGRDLRHGFRSLAKHPGFTAMAVATLALGVGANAAIFSVLRGVVLQDLPYHDAARIAVLWTKNLRQNLPDGSSYLNFRDWKDQSREFVDMAAYLRPEFTRGTLASGSQIDRVQTGLVGPGFFQLLGTPPLLGRTLQDGDFTDQPRAIVISHDLWQQRFAADPRVIGQTVLFNQQTVEVVGVMPPAFELPTADVQVWQPLFFGPTWQNPQSRDIDALVVLGRLAPSATITSARAEMDGIAARLRAAYPASNASLGVTTDPLTDRVIGGTTERALWLLFGSVGFVLLIACANVASLMLTKAAARRHEFSLRTSLGASKFRLVQQAVTEMLILSALAAAVGLLVARVGTLALGNFAAGALPRAEAIQMSPAVVLFLIAASLASGLLAAALPVLQLSTARPAELLREGGPRTLGGRSGRRIHQGLVTIEVALAVMLLCGAGLLIRSFQRVQGTARGFDSENVLLLQVDLPGAYDNQAKRTQFYLEAARRLRALPGVTAVGAISDFFIHRQPDYRIVLEGQAPRAPDEAAPPLTEDQVLPGYFEAMRIPLLRGRLLQESDLAPDAPQVVVINDAMARRFWPGQDPLGRRFKYGSDPGSKAPWKTVVGVVADMRRQRLDEPAIPYMFQPTVSSQMDIAVRTAGDPRDLRDALRAELRALDPNVPPYGIVTAEERLGQTVALRRLQTMLLGGLAAVALILALVGTYGVIQQGVAARTREIGIRVALGANAQAVRTMVLVGGMMPAAGGLALGLLGAAALSRIVASFLYETSPFDPLIYVAVTVLLLVVTTMACVVPARRAAGLDPSAALRHA
jgi:predicted permease